ncbi:MBL fold metallo-hydrolase [sulfur-oxidizing endosymbiont of Gigantopelta aegis]|uniref:MBL fold metallo-hydrolase n=1 Tax=sulfur-oxidizing endosymbiont of Gigantopelta aegis TaxID=2794934 RepID=UPI0018DCFCD2|nr:MBL fold metallo-hydrolase [sulfur-oxidizing endosymbiont of Gigantopelta aegis]
MTFKKSGLLATLYLTCLLLALALTSSPSMAEKHHSDSPDFKTIKVSDKIWMLQGKGGNIALLAGQQGLLMVDDDYKVMSKALIKELQQFGGLNKLTYIINTHWHGDHTEGNLALGTEAHIVAHNNVRTRLLTAQEIKLFKMKSAPYPESALPDVTYTSAMTLHINKEVVNIVHYANGHTDGDSIVFFKKANVVHMGDHHFSGFFPFVDIDHGGNVLHMAENVKQVLTLIDDKTQVIPGHGPLSKKTDLQDFYEMLIGTSAEVKAMMDSGLSLTQIQEKGLSSQWQAWTDGFLSTEVWISIVYNSLLTS